MDNKYLELVYNGLDISVKLDDEGVVLDVFEGDDVVATTYKTYDEFGVEVTDQEPSEHTHNWQEQECESEECTQRMATCECGAHKDCSGVIIESEY